MPIPDFDYIDAVSSAASVDALHEACGNLCEAYEFDRFIYGARVPTSFVKPYFIFIGSYPSEWRDHYSRSNYMVVDPTVEYCARSITPLHWNGENLLNENNPEIRRFMSEAHDFGINSGVSFPLHTAQGDFAMLSFASERQCKDFGPRLQRVLPIGQLFTAYLHEAVRRVFASDVLTLTRVDLTGREKECLLWATEGKTAWETSRILSISERTVTFHLQNVQHKLGVNNRQQAVARAVAQGIIEPQLV